MMNSYVGSTAVDVTYDRDRTMSPKSSWRFQSKYI
jgi:hypothetical protein